MIRQEHISLKPYNTFDIDCKADSLAIVTTLEEFKTCIRNNTGKSPLILGGGSNILLTRDYDGLVIKNDIHGIELVQEDTDHVWIKACSGENWHGLVLHCISNGWAGIENLSLIPGTVGAAPMQNIGAYGVEIKDVFDSLEALNLDTLELEVFDTKACAFGYRESVFKRKLKGHYFIYSVTFKLNKTPHFNISYGDVAKTLEEHGYNKSNLTIKAVSDAVISIRQSKLPDPKDLGNSGSFFKNPSIPAKQFAALQINHPGIKGFPQNDGTVKVAAGWLIETLGWKGKRVGQTGSHARQALVLVNYGNATGNEVWQLAKDIIHSVQDAFGITLEPEVNII